jgi:hypothetical protein
LALNIYKVNNFSSACLIDSSCRLGNTPEEEEEEEASAKAGHIYPLPV